MKLLIIDDSQQSILLLKSFLSSAGYNDIHFVESAKEAFDYLRIGQSSENALVDLILMDIMMPEIDGIEATQTIKNDQRYRDVPIIVVSAKNESDSLERAFEAGALDYIEKPVNKVELRARVRSFLRLKEEIDQRKAREQELLEISQRLEKANNQLQKLSDLDGLTGAPNRRFFERVIQKEWGRGTRESQPLSLLLVDIDFFKKYNDYYGHLQGDVCLKKVAAALGESIHRPADFVARYGGEEFVAVLPKTCIKGALHLAETMHENIKNLHAEHKESEVSDIITISVGAACIIPKNDSPYSLLVDAADKALYDAKRSGRNKTLFEDLCQCKEDEF